MILINKFTPDDRKVIRIGLLRMAQKSIDAQWYIDNFRDGIESMRNEKIVHNDLELQPRVARSGEDELIPFAELFMQIQFLYPYSKSLYGIKTEVDEEIIAIACRFSRGIFGQKAEKIINLAAESESIAIKSYLLGFNYPIMKSKIKSITYDEINALSLVNPTALIYVERSLVSQEHWNQAILTDHEVVSWAPSDKIDEDVFRYAIGKSHDLIGSFLSVPGNKLSSIKNLNKKEFIKIAKKSKIDIGLCLDFLSKNEAIEILKENPSSIGYCSVIGHDNDIDRVALDVAFNIGGLTKIIAIAKCSSEILFDFYNKNKEHEILELAIELNSRGYSNILSDEFVDKEFVRHLDNKAPSYAEDESHVEDELDDRESRIIAAIIEMGLCGLDEEWLISNFPNQLKRMLLELNIESDSSDLIRPSKDGEHYLFPVAQHFLKMQFIEPYKAEIYGIETNIPNSFIISECLSLESEADDIILSGGDFSGTIFELACESDEALIDIYSSGFSSGIGMVRSATRDQVRNISINNPAALEFIDENLISNEDYRTALIRDKSVLRFIPVNRIDKGVLEIVSFAKGFKGKYSSFIGAIDLSGIENLNKELIFNNCIANGVLIDNVSSLFDESELALIASVDPFNTHRSALIGKSEAIDLEAIKASYYNHALHFRSIADACKTSARKALELGFINNEIVSDIIYEKIGVDPPQEVEHNEPLAKSSFDFSP